MPPAARYYAKQQLFERVRAVAKEKGTLAGDDVRAIWRELLPRLGLRASAV